MLLGRTLFAIRPYHQAVYYQITPSNPSLLFAPNPHLITALLLHYQKSRILNPSKKPNRVFSSWSLLPVVSNGEFSRATSVVTNFSCKGVKQTPESLALLRPAYHATWPY